MMKSEKAMGEALKRVAKVCQNDDIRTQMNKIKKEFIGKRVVGAPESTMQVLSMWLMKKSRKVTSVNTNMKDKHVSRPKTQQQLAQMDDDDENVFATSTIDRYAARPPISGNMCVAKFAVNYDVTQAHHEFIKMQEMDANELSETEEYDSCTKVRLKDGLGYMQKRKQEAILHVARYKVQTEPEKYYHAKLILFYPGKNEDDLITGFNFIWSHTFTNKISYTKMHNCSMRIVKDLIQLWKLLRMMSYHNQHGIP